MVTIALTEGAREREMRKKQMNIFDSINNMKKQR